MEEAFLLQPLHTNPPKKKKKKELQHGSMFRNTSYFFTSISYTLTTEIRSPVV
jgi:hypothetical protein